MFLVVCVIIVLIMATWSSKRQISYLVMVLGFFAVVGFIFYFVYKPAPTCFDDKRNQNELGVDCGGVCQVACLEEVKPLKIYWARPLNVGAGWYDLVAQVENLNEDFGNRELPYVFSVYDADNVLITRRSGSTFVNPKEKFFIFESRVKTGDKEARKAFLEFSTSSVWEKITPIENDIYIERREFSNEPKPLLHLSVGNKGQNDLSNIKVITVLSDINNNVFAASATVVDKLLPNTRQEAYFTWLTPFASDPSYIDSIWRINSFKSGK